MSTRLLLDTHALLWFILNDRKLAEANRLIMDLRNQVLVSPASYWEIAIKISHGESVLDVDEDFGTFMDREFDRIFLKILPFRSARRLRGETYVPPPRPF